MTVAEFVAAWPDLGVGRSPVTTAHNMKMVREFAREHGHLPMVEVTPVLAQRWVRGRGGQARYLKLLFSDAARLGVVDENPFARVAFRVEAKHDRTPPSTPELHRIAAEALPGFREFIYVAAFTGLRLSELAAVRREDVIEVPALRIVVTRGKGGRSGDQVAVFGEARDIVRDLCARRTGRLFSTQRNRAWSVDTAGDAWRAARGEFPGTFHCLRRYHATWLLDRGASPLDVSTQLRHFDKQGRPNIELVTRLYGHPDHGEALSRLEALAS